MMKARLGNSPPEAVAVPVLFLLEGDDQVEGPLCDTAHAGRDDTRAPLVFRDTDPTLVRVRREIFDAARSRRVAAQEFVHGSIGRDPLVIAVAAGVVVGPGDR